MNIGKYNFDLEKEPVIMGILNVTPDSFSDGGKFNNLDAALKHTEEMIKDGAKIIDVGGESTRPGYTLISDEEEIGRVVPVIEAIKKNFDIAVSLDTKTGVAACVMHNKNVITYNDFVNDVVNELKESVEIAHKAGVKDSQIVLDPGVGFAKDYEQNLLIIKHVDKLLELGYPVLLGTSRKSVIGLTLDVDKNDRMAGTVATTVMGLERGCRIFRVHDVKENYQAMMMAEKILKA